VLAPRGRSKLTLGSINFHFRKQLRCPLHDFTRYLVVSEHFDILTSRRCDGLQNTYDLVALSLRLVSSDIPWAVEASHLTALRCLACFTDAITAAPQSLLQEYLLAIKTFSTNWKSMAYTSESHNIRGEFCALMFRAKPRDGHQARTWISAFNCPKSSLFCTPSTFPH
jgi:hypothetical protein